MQFQQQPVSMDDELEAWRRATPEELLQMCVDDRQRDDEVLAHVLDVQFNLLQDLHHLIQDERQPVRRRQRSKAFGLVKLHSLSIPHFGAFRVTFAVCRSHYEEHDGIQDYVAEWAPG